MKLKNYLLIILLILVIFMGVSNVRADSFDLSLHGKTVYSVNTDYHVLNKKLGSNIAFCISGMNVTAVEGTTCKLSNSLKGITDKQRSVIGQIINKGCTNDCSNFGDDYLVTEVAIIEYLQSEGIVGNGGGVSDSALVKKANTIISYAKENSTYSIYNASDFDVEFSVDKLNFTKSGDVYKSQTIKLKKIPQVNEKTIKLSVSGVEGANIVGDYNSFYITVPVKNVTKDITINLNTGTVKQKKYYISRIYNCSSGQDVTRFISSQRSGSDTISGVITLEEKPTGTLYVNKVDENGKPLVGATIEIVGPNFDESYVTDGTRKTFSGLEFGTYIIKEIKSPAGYILASNITVTLSNSSLTNTVTMKNQQNKVIISKTDLTGKNELPGATLEIQDKDGNIVKYCTNSQGQTGVECKWVSTDKPYEIKGMPNGTYYLIETIAPNGYVLSKEKKEFTVKNNELETKVSMANKLIKVEISKISAVTNKELAGATLEIQDKDGNIVKYCTNSEGQTGVECKWVSTDKSYIIEGMPNGIYYLVEKNSPKGYALNTKKIEFTVDNTKSENELIKVEMKNDLEVEVPDTLSSRSTLLLAIAMLDIALGIGIVTYVKKNKITK